MLDKNAKRSLNRLIQRNGFVSVLEELKWYALERVGKGEGWDVLHAELTKAVGRAAEERRERIERLTGKRT